MKDAFRVARSIQKHVRRLKSTYSHPPITKHGDATFPIILNDGRTLEVLVREVDHYAELEHAMAGMEACPFCGPSCSIPELVQRDGDMRWQVIHGPCGSATGHATTPEQALSMWNTRNRYNKPHGVFERIQQGLREAIAFAQGDTIGCVVHDGRVLSARRQIGLYHRAYRDEDVRQLMCQLADDDAAIFERSNERGHITTSALVVNPSWTKVLMVEHRQLAMWLQPGGHYEGNVPLSLSALREVEEETGIRPYQVFDDVPLDIDTHLIPVNPTRGEGEHYHHDFVYLMIASEDDPVPQQQEVSEARWVDINDASQRNHRMSRMIDKARIMKETTK